MGVGTLRRHYQKEATTVDYSTMKKDELVALAMARGILGADKLKKEELILALSE